MKKLLTILILCVVMTAARGAISTTDLPLNVTLLPNSQYLVTATVSTDLVSSLLALLGGTGQDVLQILDSNGNVVGSIPAQSLIDAVTGLTGSVTKDLTTTLNTTTTGLTGLVARVLDDNPAIQVGGVTVSPVSASSANRVPTVKITRKSRHGTSYQIRGTASDDSGIQRVEVVTNGHLKKATGTSSWHSTAKLHTGTNHIMVRAFDTSGTESAPARVTVKVSS